MINDAKGAVADSSAPSSGTYQAKKGAKGALTDRKASAVAAARKRRRGGRPIKSADQKANRRLTCNTTAQRAAKIEATAKAVRKSISAFLEACALGVADKLPIIPGLNLLAVRELRRQGVNLNQLTAAHNVGKHSPEALRVLTEIRVLYAHLINFLLGDE